MRLKIKGCMFYGVVYFWTRREKDYPQLPNANLAARQSGHCLRIFEMVGPYLRRFAGLKADWNSRTTSSPFLEAEGGAKPPSPQAEPMQSFILHYSVQDVPPSNGVEAQIR